MTSEAEELAKCCNLTIFTPPSNDPQTKLLNSNAKICILPHKLDKSQKKVAARFRTLMRPYLWEEWWRILRKGKNIKRRLLSSLAYAVNAEYIRTNLKKYRKIPSDAIIYTYWTMPETLALTVMYGKTHNIITRMHGMDLYNERWEGRQPFRHYIQKRVKNIYFACDYGKRYYENTFDPKDGLCRLARLGVKKRAESPAYSKKEPFVLYSCSSLLKLKRVERIIDTLASVTEKPIHWVHIGYGDNFEELRSYAEERLKDSSVTFEMLGRMTNPNVHRYLADHRIDAMITLSTTEGGCPVSIQEAMAYSIPVIGTDIGGITEMIDGNGILLSSDPSINEIKAAILQLVNSTESELFAMRARSLELWNEMFNAEKTISDFFESINLKT